MRETQSPLGELTNLWVDEPAVPFHIALAGVGIGTRFRVRFGHGVRDSSGTYVGFDLPRRRATTSTSRHLDVRLDGAGPPGWGRSWSSAPGCGTCPLTSSHGGLPGRWSRPEVAG